MWVTSLASSLSKTKGYYTQMQNEIELSTTKIKNEISLLTNKEIKEYKARVEENIKELELAIRALEEDQQQLNAINNLIEKELCCRSFVI